MRPSSFRTILAGAALLAVLLSLGACERRGEDNGTGATAFAATRADLPASPPMPTASPPMPPASPASGM